MEASGNGDMKLHQRSETFILTALAAGSTSATPFVIDLPVVVQLSTIMVAIVSTAMLVRNWRRKRITEKREDERFEEFASDKRDRQASDGQDD